MFSIGNVRDFFVCNLNRYGGISWPSTDMKRRAGFSVRFCVFYVIAQQTRAGGFFLRSEPPGWSLQ